MFVSFASPKSDSKLPQFLLRSLFASVKDSMRFDLQPVQNALMQGVHLVLTFLKSHHQTLIVQILFQCH